MACRYDVMRVLIVFYNGASVVLCMNFSGGGHSILTEKSAKLAKTVMMMSMCMHTCTYSLIF